MTNSRPPSFWKVAPGTCWLQVHSPQQARKVNRRPDAQLVAYSVAGSYLRTFEISKSEQWVKDYVSRQLYANEAFLEPDGPQSDFDPRNGMNQGTPSTELTQGNHVQKEETLCM